MHAATSLELLSIAVELTNNCRVPSRAVASLLTHQPPAAASGCTQSRRDSRPPLPVTTAPCRLCASITVELHGESATVIPRAPSHGMRGSVSPGRGRRCDVHARSRSCRLSVKFPARYTCGRRRKLGMGGLGRRIRHDAVPVAWLRWARREAVDGTARGWTSVGCLASPASALDLPCGRVWPGDRRGVEACWVG